MLKNLEIAMNVPSGKLVVEDDLRYLFPEVAEDGGGQGGQLWTKRIMEAYGKAGLLHGFVGNSCPGVYKHGNILYIGNNPYKNDNLPKVPGERVAGISTDLWWYSICDYDEFIKRGGKVNRSIHPWQNPDIVKVTPGRYILSHRYTFSDCEYWGREGRTIFATIEKTYRSVVKWELPEENLETELKRILTELEELYITPMEGRTVFELFVVTRAMNTKEDLFKVRIPAEIIRDHGSVAVLIKKKQAKRRRERRYVSRRFRRLENLNKGEEKKFSRIAAEIYDTLLK